MAARKAEVIITCNASTAKQVLEGINRELNKAIKEREQLLQKQKQNGTLTQEEIKRDRELQKYISSLTSAQQKSAQEMRKYGEVMKDLAGSKTKDLKRALQEAKRALDNMSAKDPNRQKLINDIKQIQRQIEKNTAGMQSFGKMHTSVWQSAVRNITAYVGVFGAFNLLKNKIRDVIKGSAELSDEMANIRKVSGLAMEDIEDLTRALAKMDTRTTLSELEQIAYRGAKLGFGEYGTEGLLEFARAANQVNVALKEDLGEEALAALSKITENMGLIKKMGVENAMLAAGSAMFKLASTSTAAAGPIVEVTKRLVPVAQAAGFAADEIFAIASASDSLQLMPEVVGTAMSKLIMAMQKNHNLIEKYLTIEPGTIASMVKAGDAMGAMQLIFEKMHGKNITELDGLMKLLGSDGQRLITVVMAMANHTDTLNKHLETSRKAFKEGTAVTEEYNIQQETAMAYMERASNAWRNSMINPDSVTSVKQMAKAWYDFTRGIVESDYAMSSINFTIRTLLASIRMLINLLPMITFGLIAKGAALLYTKLLSAKLAVDGFTLSWKKMDAATKSNWIGLLVGVLTQAAFWTYQWANSMSDAEKQQLKFNDAISQANEKAEQEIDGLSRLKRQIDDTNLSQEDRNKLLSKVRVDYDAYLNYLGIEIKTVDELAKHYDALTKVMRQRFAYQEREEYKRDVMGGQEGSRMQRRNTGAELKKLGKGLGFDVDLESIGMYVNNGVAVADAFAKIYPDIDRAITNINKAEGTARAFGGNVGPRSKDVTKYTDFSRKFSEYFEKVRNEIDETKRIDDAFAEEIGDFDYDKWLRTQVKGDFSIKPDKEELKRQKAEEAARRKALRAEMKEEQTKAKAIIDNVKNYYQRQINAVTEMANETGMNKELQDQMTEGLQQRMNGALANVRKAIGGTKNEWDAFKQTMRDDLYEPLGEDGTNFSTELLDKVMDNQLSELRKMIETLSKALNQNGSVLLDQILRKATENEGKNAKMDNKLMRARQKELLEKNYTGKVDLNYENQMEQFGIGGITQMQSQQIRQYSETNDAAAIKKFFDDRTKLWNDGFKQARKHIIDLMMIDIEAEGGADRMMQLLYGKDYHNTLKGTALEGLLDMDATQWKIYYQKLIEYTDQWTDAQKKAYDEQKKRQDYLFKNRPDIQAIDEMAKVLEQRQKNREKSGEAEGGFLQRAGFTSPDEDPELARFMLLEDKARLYYETMERLRQQDLVSEQMVQDAKNGMITAQTNTQQHLIAQLNERMTALTAWVDPIKQFGSEIGEAMYDQWHNGESMTVKWQDMLKKMGLAYGQMTLKILEELMIQKLKQKIVHKAMQTEETAHQTTMAAIEQAGATSRQVVQEASGEARIITEQATDTTIEGQAAAHNTMMLAEDQGMAAAENAVNISRASGKTLADLGWWGIPLVAVIMALLNGLLQAALGTSNKNTETKSTSSTNAANKLKLVSGMLTYDEGNVQNYVGQDGHVYRAREAGQIPEGVSLVKQPIATTVNGQPSLVAEKGPEIVIGRRTTARIMMNEPRLLHHLATLGNGRSYGGYRGLRTFDEGNLDDMVGGGRNNGITSSRNNEEINAALERNAAALEQNAAAMAAFSQMMAAIQQQGIPATVQQFGKGSLDEGMRSVTAFRRRYPVG